VCDKRDGEVTRVTTHDTLALRHTAIMAGIKARRFY